MQWFALTLLKEEPWRYNTGEQSASSALDRLPHSWATEPVRPGLRAGGLEGVGRGSGKLGREGPLAEGSILDAAREIFCGHTHTHTYGNAHTVHIALLPRWQEQLPLSHTQRGQYQYAHIVFDLRRVHKPGRGSSKSSSFQSKKTCNLLAKTPLDVMPHEERLPSLRRCRSQWANLLCFSSAFKFKETYPDWNT